jgi:hypothetical protein
VEKHRLRVFENRAVRTIFGPKRDEVTGYLWRLYIEELCNMCSSPDIPGASQIGLCYTELDIERVTGRHHIHSEYSDGYGKGKGKAVPLQAWSGPEGSRKLKFPDFMTTAQDGGTVVSLTHRPPLPPGNTPGTHYC